MTGMYQVYERGQTHFQIGDNTNLFDWTYVGNVARAHLLAADKLDVPAPPPLAMREKIPTSLDEVGPLTEEEENIIGYPLPSISVTTGYHRIPTCNSRPLGPYVTLPPDAEKIEASFFDPNPPPSNCPVVRTRFDPLSEHSINRLKLHNPEKNPLQVAGQAFFITNGEPCYFWDFARSIWHQLDAYFPEHRQPRSIIKLPRSLGLTAASAAEWFGWLTGKEPTFTRFKVTFSCATRWHNIEKARRVLGYEPEVGVEEGIRRTVDVSSVTSNLMDFSIAHIALVVA